jgi:hypothetical protein
MTKTATSINETYTVPGALAPAAARKQAGDHTAAVSGIAKYVPTACNAAMKQLFLVPGSAAHRLGRRS